MYGIPDVVKRSWLLPRSFTAAEVAWRQDLACQVSKGEPDNCLGRESLVIVNQLVASWLPERMFDAFVQILHGKRYVISCQSVRD